MNLIERLHRASVLDGPFLEHLGFETHGTFYQLWIDGVSYLQLIPPLADEPWTAELAEVIDGETTAVAIPRPITQRSQVYLLISALGGRANPYPPEPRSRGN